MTENSEVEVAIEMVGIGQTEKSGYHSKADRWCCVDRRSKG